MANAHPSHKGSPGDQVDHAMEVVQSAMEELRIAIAAWRMVEHETAEGDPPS